MITPKFTREQIEQLDSSMDVPDLSNLTEEELVAYQKSREECINALLVMNELIEKLRK